MLDSKRFLVCVCVGVWEEMFFCNIRARGVCASLMKRKTRGSLQSKVRELQNFPCGENEEQ